MNMYFSYISSSATLLFLPRLGMDARTPSSSAYGVIYVFLPGKPFRETPIGALPSWTRWALGNRFLRCAKRGVAKNKVYLLSLFLFIPRSFRLPFFLVLVRPPSPSTFLSSSVCRSSSLLILSPFAFRSEPLCSPFSFSLSLARSRGAPVQENENSGTTRGARGAQNPIGRR